MNVQPNDLQMMAADRLRIEWSDGQVREYSLAELRENCPCATCNEKRKAPPPATSLPVVSQAETEPLQITEMRPMGNYAYAIDFSDGHNTGIYTLELLREIGQAR